MNQVTYGRRILGCEVLVAAVAIAKRPLILMLVAAEAGGHLGPDRVGVLVGHGLVTADAIAVCGRLMGTMLEAQVLTRESRTLTGVGGSMAPETRMLVMRLRMAAHTCRVGGKVQRLDVTRGGHALVAVDAINPVRRVRAMLEGMRRVAGS
jgi:hypothetical protein